VRDRRFVLFALKDKEVSWRGLGLLAFVFLGSLIFAACILPGLYWIAQWAAIDVAPQLAQSFLANRVDKVFDFLRWLPVLVGLPWVMWLCHLWSFESLGLGRTGHVRSTLVCGFVVGSILVALLGGGQIAFGATFFNPRAEVSLAQIAEWVVLSLVFAIIVALTEEVIFRGLVLRLFNSATLRPWLALILSSAFFAYTHFKIPPGGWTKLGAIHWDTGWYAAYWMLVGIGVEFDFKRFVALLLLGMVLGTLMLRTGSLWPGIALHSGLVFGMLLYHDLVNGFEIRSFWGSKALIDGWAGVSALAILFLLVLTSSRSGHQRIKATS
jgi:membrane protease YdiL (CAAX protease family)